MGTKRLKYNRETNVIEVIEDDEDKNTATSRRDKIKGFFKGLPYIAIIGLLISLSELFFQNKSLILQNKEYKSEIEKMNIELKEGYTQIKTSYISCNNFFGIDKLNDDGFKIVQNEISELTYEDIKENPECDDSSVIYPDIFFLSLESMGTRNLNSMKVILKKVVYKEDIYGFYGKFSLLDYDDKNIISCDEVEVVLGDRFAGEKILIPVFLRYALCNDIEEKESEYDELLNKGDFIVSYYPDVHYTYKCIYVPIKVIYYDSISDEEIEVEIRDLLDYHLKIDEFTEDRG